MANSDGFGIIPRYSRGQMRNDMTMYLNRKNGLRVQAIKQPAHSMAIDSHQGQKTEMFYPRVDFWQITDGFGSNWISGNGEFNELYEEEG